MDGTDGHMGIADLCISTRPVDLSNYPAYCKSEIPKTLQLGRNEPRSLVADMSCEEAYS